MVLRMRVKDLAYLIQLAFTCSAMQLTVAEGSCNSKQADNCREAATSGKLDKFVSGGTCEDRQYVQFTHTCTLNNYMGQERYCCCAQERRVMCCRYQQAGQLFRCQGEDVIDTLPLDAPPLWLILVVIGGTLAVLACCACCVIKCCCLNYDSDDNQYCDLPCCRRRRAATAAEGTSEKTAHYSARMSEDDQQPLNRQGSGGAVTHYSTDGHSSLYHPPSTITQYSTDSATSETKLLRPDSVHSESPYRGEPSAPPIEEVDECPESAFINFTNGDRRYNRLSSEVSSCSVPPYQASAHVHFPRSISTPNGNEPLPGNERGMVTCPSCASGMRAHCPPPTYDEHHKDRVI